MINDRICVRKIGNQNSKVFGIIFAVSISKMLSVMIRWVTHL